MNVCVAADRHRPIDGMLSAGFEALFGKLRSKYGYGFWYYWIWGWGVGLERVKNGWMDGLR